MERRFRITVSENSGIYTTDITESELMKRMNKALHTARVSNVTEHITNEDEVIDILLHGEKEPDADRRAKVLNQAVESSIEPHKPTRKEWEEWVEHVPSPDEYTPPMFKLMLATWFLTMPGVPRAEKEPVHSPREEGQGVPNK